METVKTGAAWHAYLIEHGLLDCEQMDIYVCTVNHRAIYKVGDFYFTFGRPAGYRNLASLKRLATMDKA